VRTRSSSRAAAPTCCRGRPPACALADLYHRELTLTTTYSSSPADLADAFRLVVSGEIVVAPLLTQRAPLDGLADALGRMRRRETLKVFITP
jgi:threonine dehydrogenase-like Zn-dependent dehydrogenase